MEKIFGQGMYAKIVPTQYGDVVMLNFNEKFIDFFSEHCVDGKMTLIVKKARSGNYYSELTENNPNYQKKQEEPVDYDANHPKHTFKKNKDGSYPKPDDQIPFDEETAEKNEISKGKMKFEKNTIFGENFDISPIGNQNDLPF